MQQRKVNYQLQNGSHTRGWSLSEHDLGLMRLFTVRAEQSCLESTLQTHLTASMIATILHLALSPLFRANISTNNSTYPKTAIVREAFR